MARKTTNTAYLESDALISLCGKYRYWLNRWWDKTLPLAVFIMLNPSNADAVDDDPTIDCCVRLAKREGYGGIHVVNLFAYRTPKRETLADLEDPVGPDNDRHILAATRLGAVTIVAWGAYVAVPTRPEKVLKVLRATTSNLKWIERLKGGQPRHPLYLRKKATLVEFDDLAATDV